MNKPEAIRRLDEIEQLDPDPTFDVGALEIMESLGEKPEGLRLLVERYSSSPSANMVTFLALVLGEKSSKSTQKQDKFSQTTGPETQGSRRVFLSRQHKSTH